MFVPTWCSDALRRCMKMLPKRSVDFLFLTRPWFLSKGENDMKSRLFQVVTELLFWLDLSVSIKINIHSNTTETELVFRINCPFHLLDCFTNQLQHIDFRCPRCTQKSIAEHHRNQLRFNYLINSTLTHIIFHSPCQYAEKNYYVLSKIYQMRRAARHFYIMDPASSISPVF